MWVVKLGGSLLGGEALHAWLRAVAASPVPLLVVPGGGPFADAVRHAQERWRFSDAAAHRMALLAMDQMGALLLDLAPGLRRRRRLPGPGALRRTSVWLPGAALAADRDLAPGWAVTSDTIAALAARRTGAAGLVLVKSAPLGAGALPAATLHARGIVDEAFPAAAAASGCPMWLLPAERAGGLHALVAGRPAGALRVGSAVHPRGRRGEGEILRETQV